MTWILQTALPAEARALRGALALRPVPEWGRIPVFEDAGQTTLLGVSGPGRTASAITAARLAQHVVDRGTPPAAFLQFGLSGCPDGTRPIGSLYRIHQIVDASTGRHFFPDMLLRVNLPEATVVTVDSPAPPHWEGVIPSVRPQEGSLADMEASGFFQAALHFTTVERIHLLKVVSDHGISDPSRFSRPRAVSILEECAPAVIRFLSEMMQAPEAQAEPPNGPWRERADRLAHQWRLTSTQRARLLDLAIHARLTDLPVDRLLTRAEHRIPHSARERAALLDWFRNECMER